MLAEFKVLETLLKSLKSQNQRSLTDALESLRDAIASPTQRSSLS
jgi:hypothetical protein